MVVNVSTYQTPEDRGEISCPPHVVAESDKNRWNAAARAAMVVIEEPQENAEVVAATRALYGSDLPTE